MKNEEMQITGSEIDLMDVSSFVKNKRKYMVFGSLVGLMLAAAYVVLTPKQYEARWNMQMAQYVYDSKIVSIEEPGALAERLRSPTAYPEEVKRVCGIPGDEEFGEYLGGTLKVAVTKNSNDVLGMKLTALGKDEAKNCAEAIASMITRQQRALIEERLAGSQQQLAQYKQTLKDEQADLEALKKSDASSFGYLAKLGLLSSLRTRMDSLQEAVFTSQLRPAKLVSPIYVPSKPVSPKVALALVLGITLGLMLGLLSAFIAQAWRESK